MTVEHIIGLAEQGMPTLLIIVGLIFGYFELWPWWKQERDFQREHKTERMQQAAKADIAIASAIDNLAVSVRTCPLKSASDTDSIAA